MINKYLSLDQFRRSKLIEFSWRRHARKIDVELCFDALEFSSEWGPEQRYETGEKYSNGSVTIV